MKKTELRQHTREVSERCFLSQGELKIEVRRVLASQIGDATTDAIRSQSETLGKAACDFRNKNRYQTIVLFHVGRLDLYPVTH